MNLTTQKRLSADIFGCSPKKVWFDSSRLEDIKGAITKVDIRSLMKQNVIMQKPDRGVSRGRARKVHVQKVKGRRKGHGSRQGKQTSRLPRKLVWINKIRAQRELLNILKDKNVIDKKTFRMLYLKAKGGFFRSRRHIKVYLEEHGLAKIDEKIEKPAKKAAKEQLPSKENKK